MILMGFNYGINSLKFIKSVQLTASFQQVRFPSIKFQVQKKIRHVNNAMSVSFLYLFQFWYWLKMVLTEDFLLNINMSFLLFQVNLTVSSDGNGVSPIS